jgi:HlyD family secretion protein
MKPVVINGMDVIRPRRAAPPRVLIVIAAGVVLAVATAASLFSLSHGSTSGPSVDRSTVVTDVAREGTLQRSISASGMLAAENIRIVAAIQAGVVESVFVKPGTEVEAGSPIAQLSNPDLEADVVTARSAVDVARAQMVSVQQQAKASALSTQSSLISARAQAQEDSTNLQSLRYLHSGGYIADQTFRIADIKANQSSTQLGVARAQIAVDAAEQQAKIAQARSQFDQAQAQLQAKEAELAALVVRARSAGVVQSVAVDPGARVEAGAELARVADQRDLKAVLDVPEGQVHSVNIGVPVRIDSGNGLATGRVARIAPAAQNGSVAVDVIFAQALPPGARPDLNVDGTIDLETLRHVLSIARPAGASDDTTVGLYRIDRGSNVARLVNVRLGRGSTDRVQVLSGLEPGDAVIVSDTSAYGGAPALRLH